MKVETLKITWNVWSQGRFRHKEAPLGYVTQAGRRCRGRRGLSSAFTHFRLHTLLTWPQFSWCLGGSHSGLSYQNAKKWKSEKQKGPSVYQVQSYEIPPNPLDAPWPSQSYLKISFENNLSNKLKTYLLTNLSCDLTFWAQPQQKQKDEAKACRGWATVCVCFKGQHWLWQCYSNFPNANWSSLLT